MQGFVVTYMNIKGNHNFTACDFTALSVVTYINIKGNHNFDWGSRTILTGCNLYEY